MEIRFTRTLVILMIATFAYSSCKKNETKPAKTAQTVNTAVYASQLALNIYKSITGGYGGVNIGNGVKASVNGVSHRGPVNYSTNPLCGFTSDTAFNYQDTVADTVTTNKGSVRFYYSCTNNVVDGYTVTDSLSTIGLYPSPVGPLDSYIYSLNQGYIVKSLNASYTLVSVDGTNTLYISHANGIYTNSHFTLAGLRIDVSNPSSPDITTGTTTFLMLVSTAQQFDTLTGTIYYLGNHEAKVSFNIGGPKTKDYMVNLLTGVVTPL